MSTNKRHFRERFLSANRKMLQLLEKSKPTLAFYEHIILPVEVFFFKAGNYKISPTFRQELIKAKETFFTEEEKQNPRKSRKLENQLIKSYISQQFTIKEFFLYGLRDMKFKEKRTYLSDLERKSMLDEVGNEAADYELTNKGKFYLAAKKYFKREACIIHPQNDINIFVNFTSKHPTFIVKPIEGSTGHDAEILTISSPFEARALFVKLASKNTWIAEELIQQHPTMSMWNPTSVNTLRVPTIATDDGIKILQPFFRTGRKGAVIDNAGQGGIFAVFNPETGILTTDGVDEIESEEPPHIAILEAGDARLAVHLLPRRDDGDYPVVPGLGDDLLSVPLAVAEHKVAHAGHIADRQVEMVSRELREFEVAALLLGRAVPVLHSDGDGYVLSESVVDILSRKLLEDGSGAVEIPVVIDEILAVPLLSASRLVFGIAVV